MRAAEVARHVGHKVLLLALGPAEHLPQAVGLDVVVPRELAEDGGDGLAGPLLVGGGRVGGAVGQGPVGGGVVGVGAVVAVDGHGAVALEGVEGVQRLVHGDLLVVHAQAVALRVRVREEPGLEDGVGRGLDARHHVRRREGDLLDLGEVVLGVAVQREPAHRPEGDVGLGPDLGQVEDVPLEVLGLLGREDLDMNRPAGVLAPLDGLEEVLRVPVGVLCLQL